MASKKKSATKKRPAANKKAAKKSTAATVYTDQVAEILATQSKQTEWRPKSPPKLALVRVRRPADPSELAPGERAQLEAIWHGASLEHVLASEANEVELADLVNEKGELVYRLLAWNYGVGYVLVGETTEIAAMGTQHDIECWDEPSQRELFYAIDQAIASGNKAADRLNQPLSFGWWEDEAWEETREQDRPYRRVRVEAGGFVPVE
jgi:hypothetical protein